MSITVNIPASNVKQWNKYTGETIPASTIQLIGNNIAWGILHFDFPNEYRKKAIRDIKIAYSVYTHKLSTTGINTMVCALDENPSRYSKLIDITSTGNRYFEISLMGKGLFSEICKGNRIRLETYPKGYWDVQEEYITNPPHFQIIYDEIVHNFSSYYPRTGARVSKVKETQFSWSMGNNGGYVVDPITYLNAKLKIQNTGDTKVKEYIISPFKNYYSLPANTLTADSVDWQVEVKSDDGKTTVSEWQTINTKDNLSKGEAISPISALVEDINGVTFTWKHVINTGTDPTGYELQYSTDSETWTTIALESKTAITSCTIAKHVLPPGNIMWRVRTQNNDEVMGEYSMPANIIVVSSPPTPIISYFNMAPRLQIKWQSQHQQGYCVEIGEYSSGTVFGTEKEYIYPGHLKDGDYNVSLKTINNQGNWSEAVTQPIKIENLPAGEVLLAANQMLYGVRLSFSSQSEYTHYIIFRNEEEIGSSKDGIFVDYLANGKNTYFVRGVQANGNYTDSHKVIEFTQVRYACVALLENFDFLTLKFKIGAPAVQEENTTVNTEYVFYQGRQKPVMYSNGFLTTQHAISYTLLSMEDYKKLKAMQGQTVVYKDKNGSVIIGVLNDINTKIAKGSYDISFNITETEYSNEI